MATPEVRLRSSTDADRAFAFEVLRAAMGPYIQAWIGWREDEQRAIHLRRWSATRTRIAVVDGVDAGLVTTRDDGGRLRLLQMFLLPDVQGRGVGSALLRRVIDEAEACGAGVALRGLRTNPRARTFYERHGFRPVGETRSHWMLGRPGSRPTPGERFVEVDGARLWTCTEGDGPPVVLLHGGPGASDYLGPVSRMLADRCTVVRYEQRGCGRSDDVGPRTVARNVADLERLRERFGFERMVLVGHSWGAALGLAYALEHPARVTRLAYLAGVGVDLAWKAAHEEASRTRSDRDAGFVYPHNTALNRATHADWERWIEAPELRSRLRALDVPALLVHGTGDLRPGTSAQALSRRLPCARFEWIDGADHFLWLSHPAETRVLLVPFVSDA